MLADAAERGEEIDAARAKLAKERAEAQLSKVNEAAAEVALQRALLRLKAVDLVGRPAARQ
ncbi:F0F1 ATP synthase subunit epsilon [compost metagenome]